MRNRLATLAVAAIVTLGPAGCTPVTNGTITATPSTDFDLAMGASAIIEGSPLRIHFDSVPEDSRCPINVVCVWEGNATVRLSLDSAAKTQTIDLRTSGGAPTVQAFGHTIALRALRPVPTTSAQPRRDPYVATLRVTSP